MKKNIEEKIEVPQGNQVSLIGNEITIKGNGKEVTKSFAESPRITMEVKGNTFIIKSEKATKRELKLINSIVAHIKNIIAGIKEEYFYKLEICNVHFPVTVRTEGNLIKIKNFLGEKNERQAEIMPNVKVSIKGNFIELTSPNIEAAGQTAARIEIATKIKNRDRRVFQDGIFIIEKPGRRTN